MISPGALGQPNDVAPAGQGHELVDDDVQSLGLDTQGVGSGADSGHVALVVGPPDLHHPLEVPQEELIVVVGQVGGQVGGLAVAADEHVVLLLAQLAGGEPDGALPLHQIASVAQDSHHLVEGAGRIEALLAEPDIVVDIDGRQVVADDR